MASKTMTQSDLSPIGPVGVVKRRNAERVRKLIETPETPTYTLDIPDPEPRKGLSGLRNGLPVTLGSATLAILTLVDSMKLDR